MAHALKGGIDSLPSDGYKARHISQLEYRSTSIYESHSKLNHQSVTSSLEASTSQIFKMLSSSRIPNSVYNALPGIDEQSPPSNEALQAVGRIFASHGVNVDVGVSLLHKHFMLDDEAVMVHDGLRCSPALPEASDTTLNGCSFFLRDSEFQAFEYEKTEFPNLSLTFLQELGEHLLNNKLEHLVALSKLDKEHPKLMEHCEEAGKMHVCELTEDEISPAEATEWKFDTQGDFVLPVVVRGCARTGTKQHKPK